jgi:hypothetical protein
MPQKQYIPCAVLDCVIASRYGRIILRHSLGPWGGLWSVLTSIEGRAIHSWRQLFYRFQSPAGDSTVEDFVERDADWAIRDFVSLANCFRIDIQIRLAFAFSNEVDREGLCESFRIAGVAVLAEKISNVFTTERSKHRTDCTLLRCNSRIKTSGRVRQDSSSTIMASVIALRAALDAGYTGL